VHKQQNVIKKKTPGVVMLCTGFTRGRKAKISICWYFFTEGCILGNWAGLLPTAKIEQDLSNQVLGAVLVAAIIGAMSALPVVSSVTKRWGSGFSLLWGAILSIFVFPIVGVKHNLPVFVIGVFMMGFGLGWADIAMNTQAVLCEKMTRLPTLGLFHSVYALGGLFGALLSGFLVQRGLTVFGEVLSVVAVLFVPQILFSCWLYTQQEERLYSQSSVQFLSPFQHGYEKVAVHTHENALIGLPTSDTEPDEVLSLSEGLLDRLSKGSSVRSSVPSSVPSSIDDHSSPQRDWQSFNNEEHSADQIDYFTLMCISALCFLGYFGYGSVGDWSAIYLSEDFDANALESTFGFVGFSLFVALGTYSSDSFVTRFGRRRLLQCSGIVTALGLAVAVAAGNIANHNLALGCAILGFSICGMGVSVVSPSVISLAGNSVSGMDPTDAIAFVSSIGYVGIMVGPPLLGGISALLRGLRWSFVVDAVLMLNITVLASLVMEVHQSKQDSSTTATHEEFSIQ
jgi:MFS family permease